MQSAGTMQLSIRESHAATQSHAGTEWECYSTISGKQGSAAAGLSVVLHSLANCEPCRDLVMELWHPTDGSSERNEAWRPG
jgi:hypothetical protein